MKGDIDAAECRFDRRVDHNSDVRYEGETSR